MNKTKNILKILAVVLFGLLAFALLRAPVLPTKADTNPSYAFSVEQYDAVYDINADRSMSVTEDITILFKGTKSTGFIRDIPVNAGDRVTKIKVYEIKNGEPVSVDYDVYSDIDYPDFISVDIGDTSNKTQQTHTYRISYVYTVTKPKNENALYLNAVGYGWDSAISNVNLTLNLPEGLDESLTKCYVGSTSTPNGVYEYSATDSRITMHVEKLERSQGITFDLFFQSGVLKKASNPVPYLFALIGLILLAAAVIVKLFVFRQKELTPVVNFTAPDDMDPLIMGKYIDNTVDNEDVTSLIYYWASKGFIVINLENESDPQIIRITQKLPQDYPHYQHTMYNNMFRSGDAVKISSLTNKFYTTVESVKNEVNHSVKNLYKKNSINASGVFTFISILFMGLIPNLCAMATVSVKYFNWIFFLAGLPVLLIYGLLMPAVYNRLKMGEKKYKGALLACAALSAAVAVIVALLLSLFGLGAVMDWIPSAINLFIGYLTGMVAVSMICRTDAYTAKLNWIIGFKNFITLTEKDRLEAMLADDPQLYYHVLPYAQVLGVTGIWEKKFEGITMQPPQWITGNRSLLGTYIEVRVLTSLLHNTTANMTRNMVSRPQSSGASGGGGHFGGGFGGFGGGGHGGGGGRGR